jgi:hypothetical protein
MANCSKLGIEIGETSVSKCMVRRPKPPSQTWRTFPNNHVKALVSADFSRCRLSAFEVHYVFLVLAHERRRVVHFNVTTHPTAEWTASNCARPFRSIKFRGIYCAIETGSSVTTSAGRLRI